MFVLDAINALSYPNNDTYAKLINNLLEICCVTYVA